MIHLQRLNHLFHLNQQFLLMVCLKLYLNLHAKNLGAKIKILMSHVMPFQ